MPAAFTEGEVIAFLVKCIPCISDVHQVLRWAKDDLGFDIRTGTMSEQEELDALERDIRAGVIRERTEGDWRRLLAQLNASRRSAKYADAEAVRLRGQLDRRNEAIQEALDRADSENCPYPRRGFHRQGWLRAVRHLRGALLDSESSAT